MLRLPGANIIKGQRGIRILLGLHGEVDHDSGGNRSFTAIRSTDTGCGSK